MFGKKNAKTQNTRQHKRLKAAFLVKYQTGVMGDAARITNIKDISAGGARFLTREMLPASGTIKVNVLAQPLGRTFEAEARVLRMRRNKRTFIYSVAVQFTNISEKDKLQLNQFIENVANDEHTSFCIDHADVVVRGKMG
ncbi:MAG: PilZ domain-containing protein [Candidatus Omnitrophica bacterium]|nr:PilZ domain-containing protein [Candidatus Omnitrophota bacterium]